MAPPKGHNIPAVMVVSFHSPQQPQEASAVITWTIGVANQTVNTKAKTLERGHKH